MLILKINYKKLIFSIIIPLLVGGISAYLTRDSMSTFERVAKPPLSPPGWLFPIVWTILYILMGIASYLVNTSKGPKTLSDSALAIYALQLVFNFFWSIIFFNMEAYLFAFIWLIALWLLILWTTVSFYKINKTAGLLMIPYLIWVAFAGYLNLGIYLLNK